MFFTPELLEKRDGGFGLLWLAATLGSKSTFKKLPKRSVLTADIAQLCDLIAEPAEPLALRLSSNLMVGVARVYRVKQEIFISDVTTCFNSLKKVIQELHSISATDAQLQMAQPSVRPSALTLVADPRMAFGMDFDNLVADWDEYLNMDNSKQGREEDDDDFDPKSKKAKLKGKPSLPLTENIRGDLHTLNENHDHLLSASFDVSISGSGPILPSSSQFDGGFGFGLDDDFFGASDGLDIGGGIGDELARELGEGWGGSPMKSKIDIDMDVDAAADFEMDIAMDFDMENEFPLDNEIRRTASPMTGSTRKPEKNRKQISDKENLPPSFLRASSLTPHLATSPASFSQQLLALDSEHPPPEEEKCSNKRPLKRTKKVRLLLDPRTELTDDELKTARTQYLEGQNILRHDICQKKSEKASEKIVENMLWGVPMGFQAQVLVDFWLENFKVQVEARSGLLHVALHDEPPRKRRKVREAEDQNPDAAGNVAFGDWNADPGIGMDMDMVVGFGDYDIGGTMPSSGRIHSSEEPGQGRRGTSRPLSIRGSNFGIDAGTQNSLGGSQRSNFFPWDHAGDGGASSSVTGIANGFAGPGSDKVSFDHVEVGIMGSSASARGSSLLPSRMGSLGGVPEFSDVIVQGHDFAGEDFAFDIPANNPTALESPPSDFNLVNLERNCFNFLEYARMQFQGLSEPSAFLTFEDVVPKSTSNAHVASAAMYHCLVLGTKDLIRLNQPEAYGPITIIINS